MGHKSERESMKMKHIITTVIPFFSILIFSVLSAAQPSPREMYRSRETENLMQNLLKLSENRKTMFGVANGNSIGYNAHLKYINLETSDTKEITGANPAFIESDFMWYDNDSFRIADMQAMKLAYQRGNVLGYCWHLRGMNSNSFYAKDRNQKFTSDKELVKQIISPIQREQNKALDWYLTEIDSLVIPVVTELGFPMVFRPFHEMNGSWFWWGTQNCTAHEYKQLFRLTVDYLRSKGVRNLLYAWSPDTWAKFEFYPGNDYVDVIGLDVYEPGIFPNKDMHKMVEQYRIITDSAAANQQVAALTETGCRKEGDVFTYPEKYPNFWTKYVLEPIVSDPKANRMVWICSWYNVDWRRDKKGQFYIPYRGIEEDHPNGQRAIDDFIRFYQHPSTLFEGDLPNMYAN